jgi:hypothetical protein
MEKINPGHIYIIENENGFVKIGRSITPDKRIRKLKRRAGLKSKESISLTRLSVTMQKSNRTLTNH